MAINFGTDPSSYNGDSGNAQIKARSMSANNDTDIILSTYNGSSFGERMRLKAGGNVGIGTTTPSHTLEVNGSVAGVGAYNNISDVRYKKNIITLSHALDKIMALRGVQYDWRTNEFPQIHFDKGRQLGLIAQEVKDVLPEAVSQNGQGYYSIAYSEVIPVLVEAVKDQRKETEKKDAEIQKLKQQNDSLAERLNELEASVKSLAEKK